jgi:hypothetical protein
VPGVASGLLLQAVPTIEKATKAIPHREVTRASVFACTKDG